MKTTRSWKQRATTLALAAGLLLNAAGAAAQANHWVFLPDIKMKTTGLASNAFSTFPGGSAITGCLSSTTPEQQPGVLSNASESRFFAYTRCGVYNASGSVAASPGGTGHDILFPIPGNCNEYWAVQWVDAPGTPTSKALKIYKYSASGTTLSATGITDITPSGTTPGGCGLSPSIDVAVAPLANDGSREIYAVLGQGLVSWTISPTGSVTAHGEIYALPQAVNNSVRMEVSGDGRYLFMNACGTVQGVMVYSVETPGVATINIGRKVTGFEFVPGSRVNGNDRLYVSSHQTNPLPAGGIYYYDLSTGGGPYTASTYLTQPAFGYTEIEYAKNGLLYFAYNPSSGSGYVAGAGTLYSFNPTASSSTAPTQMLNGGTAVPVNTYWTYGYYIQRQIDGENYDRADYSNAGSTYIGFRSSGRYTTVDEVPDVYLCDNTLEMFTDISRYHSFYRIKVETGTYTISSAPLPIGVIFTPYPVQPPSNTFIVNSTKEKDTIDLAAYMDTLKRHLGPIRITITVPHCGDSIINWRVINIKNPIAGLKLHVRANPCNNGIVDGYKRDELPIPDQIFTSTPCAKGWVGAQSGGISNFSFNGIGTVTDVTQTIDEVDPSTGAFIAFIGSKSEDFMPNSTTDFSEIVSNDAPGYFLMNYITAIYKTYRYTLSITANGCTSTDTLYFRIARDANPVSWGGGNFWRVAGENENSENTADFNISPIPANDYIKIDFSELNDEAVILITDNTGRTVQKATGLLSVQGRLNIEGLAPGIYYYSFITGSKTYHGKFIKN